MRRSAAPPPPAPSQLELFPGSLRVESLDPRSVGGASTRVQGVFTVRYATERRPHRVFHDRHGWYCEEHGRACRAVGDARAESASAGQGAG